MKCPKCAWPHAVEGVACLQCGNVVPVVKIVTVGGANPFGAVPRPAEPLEIGVGHSGIALEVRAADIGEGVGVLDINLAEVVPAGYFGMATIHLHVDDVTLNPLRDNAANTVLLCDVRWQSGRGGGEMTVEATHGAVFAVGATSVVNVKARLVSSVLGVAPQEWATKKIEATVNWNTSPAKDAFVCTPSIALVAGVASAWIRIPRQAHSMIVQGFPATALAGLLAEFSTNDNAGGNGIKMATLNPNANSTILGQGVEFFRLFSAAAPMTGVYGLFELW